MHGSTEEWATFDFDYELAAVGIWMGRSPRRLTRHPAFDNYPAWSPDGTRVAFLSDRDTFQRLSSVKAIGQPPVSTRWRRTVRTCGAWPLDLSSVLSEPPAWSPNGQSIAVTGGAPSGGRRGGVVSWCQADGTGIVRLCRCRERWVRGHRTARGWPLPSQRAPWGGPLHDRGGWRGRAAGDDGPPLGTIAVTGT